MEQQRKPSGDGVGRMPMPHGFKYRVIALRGRPRHSGGDSFDSRHPAMDLGNRAKLFSPYDALVGFSDTVAAKRALYEDPPRLSEGEQEVLGRKLFRLWELTRSRALARENAVRARARWFVPCADPQHEAWGSRGSYRELEGRVEAVDPLRRTLTLAGTPIPFEALAELDSEAFRETESQMPP